MKTADLIDEYLRDGKFPKSSFHITLEEDKHYLGNLCKRGHDYRGTGRSARSKKHRNCMICMRLNAFVWLDINRDRARAAGRAYEKTEKGRALRKAAYAKWKSKPDSRIKVAVDGALSRARASGLPHDIDSDFMRRLFEEQKGLCYWTGAPLSFEGKERHPLKLSIDRIHPSLGYTKGNVVWASNFANRARGDTPADEFSEILKHVVRHAFQKQQLVGCDTN